MGRTGRIFVCALMMAASLAIAADGAAPRFPDVEFRSITGGESVRLADLAGRPVLISFWASWCGPCRMELPELVALAYDLEATGFTLLAVNTDDSPDFALRFLKRNNIDTPAYRLSDRDLAGIGIRSLPTTILLDGDGRLVQLYRGYSPSVTRDIRARVKRLLGAGTQ